MTPSSASGGVPAALGGVTIQAAVDADFARISAIEGRAGALFRDVDMAAVAAGELPTAEQLGVPAADGRLMVATVDGGGPAGFVLTDWVDAHAHLDQVSVDPTFARRGLGQQLIAAAEHWAHQHGASSMTLTTFVDVPWNGPYYRRLGCATYRPPISALSSHRSASTKRPLASIPGRGPP